MSGLSLGLGLGLSRRGGSGPFRPLNHPEYLSGGVYVIPVEDFGYNPSAGTVLADFDVPAVSQDAFLFAISNGFSQNRIALIRRLDNLHLQAFVSSASVGQMSTDLGYVTDASRHRVAFSFAANNFSISMDGGAAATDTAGAMPTGVIRLEVGGYSGGFPWAAAIHDFRYWPHATAVATLVAMSAL